MTAERIYISALIVIALLASIPQIPIDAQVWAAILAIMGIVSGVVSHTETMVERILIYVLAIALPTFDNCLNAIWIVGVWTNGFLDNVATGIQGFAVGLFVMAMLGRIQGKKPVPT